jgi:hypothetical protein
VSFYLIFELSKDQLLNLSIVFGTALEIILNSEIRGKFLRNTHIYRFFSLKILILRTPMRTYRYNSLFSVSENKKLSICLPKMPSINGRHIFAFILT